MDYYRVIGIAAVASVVVWIPLWIVAQRRLKAFREYVRNASLEQTNLVREQNILLAEVLSQVSSSSPVQKN